MLIKHDFTDRWSIALDCSPYTLGDVSVTCAPNKRQTEPAAKLLKIRERYPTLRAATDLNSIKEIPMRLENRNVAVIVEQEYFNGQVVANNCLQFLQIHHYASITGEADDGSSARRLVDAD